jgi:hypothetical protein
MAWLVAVGETGVADGGDGGSVGVGVEEGDAGGKVEVTTSTTGVCVAGGGVAVTTTIF